MKKEQCMRSDKSIPDPLNSFAKKIGETNSIHGEQCKITARELLIQLKPAHKLEGCLPVITSVEKCHELTSDKKVNEPITKVISRMKEEEESETECSSSFLDDLELSFDGEWLKKHFHWPLRMAIKEIISRKPYDPVGYLGFWFLNYRRCQELKQLQVEEDNELNYYRSLIKEPTSKGEEVSIGGGEEEEETRDWNFKHYETAHMSK